MELLRQVRGGAMGTVPHLRRTLRGERELLWRLRDMSERCRSRTG